MKQIDRRKTALFAVSIAQQNLDVAVSSRIEAILHARQLGASWVDLGRAAGLSEAAVRRLANRHTPNPE